MGSVSIFCPDNMDRYLAKAGVSMNKTNTVKQSASWMLAVQGEAVVSGWRRVSVAWYWLTVLHVTLPPT